MSMSTSTLTLSAFLLSTLRLAAAVPVDVDIEYSVQSTTQRTQLVLDAGALVEQVEITKTTTSTSTFFDSDSSLGLDPDTSPSPSPEFTCAPEDTSGAPLHRQSSMGQSDPSVPNGTKCAYTTHSCVYDSTGYFSSGSSDCPGLPADEPWWTCPDADMQGFPLLREIQGARVEDPPNGVKCSYAGKFTRGCYYTERGEFWKGSSDCPERYVESYYD